MFVEKTGWKLLAFTLLVIISMAGTLACGDDDDDDDDIPGLDDDDDDDDNDDNDDNDDGDNQPPEFDGIVSAEGGDELAVLTWNAATDSSTPITYNVYLADSEGGQNFSNPILSTQDLTVEVTELAICYSYYFVVRAQDAKGNEDDNVVEKSAVPITYDCGYTQNDRLAWSFMPPQGPYHVETVGWIGDVDGDGIPEIIAHAYDSISTPADADTTFCLSGAGLAKGQADVLWSVRPANDSTPPASSGGYGDNNIASAGDLNGDGVGDVLLGADWGNKTAFALDGTDGSTLWMFNTNNNPYAPDSGWVYEIKPYSDITDDGIPEVIFGVGKYNSNGYLVDGETGDVIWRLSISEDAVYGANVISDVNDDGVDDGVFAAGEYEERVFCVDGTSNIGASLLWSKEIGNNYCMNVLDDVNDDGYQEVLAGSWGAGRVVALKGQNGDLLWNSEVALSPMRIVVLNDVNGDDKPDVAATGLLKNSVYVFDGTNGNLIWSGSGPATDSIWAVDAIGDITGDGINDVVAGSFDSYVIAFDGTDGTVLWSYFLGGALVKSLRATPDVTGDCVPDVVAGTQALSTSIPGSGKVFLLNGCP